MLRKTDDVHYKSGKHRNSTLTGTESKRVKTVEETPNRNGGGKKK